MRHLNYPKLRAGAVPIGTLISAMSGTWDRDGPTVTAVREAEVIIALDPGEDIGGVIYGAELFESIAAGHPDVAEREASLLVFAVDAGKVVPGTNGGTELDFLHAAIVAIKRLPLATK